MAESNREIKYIDIKEFRELGYLQELNRRFLHPLGLALEIKREDDGTESLSGIWDYRDDVEGCYFDLANSDEERIKKFKEKAHYIDHEINKRKDARLDLLKGVIEPII